MAILYRLFRYDLTSLKNQTGGSLLQAANAATYALHKQGATASNSGSLTAPGVATINVYDLGTLSSLTTADTLSVNGGAARASVISIDSATAITASWVSGTFSWVAGDRIVIENNLPTAYSDNQAITSLGSSVVSGADGRGAFWSREPILDFVISGSGFTSFVVVDVPGAGDPLEIAPQKWGALEDNAANDQRALRGMIEYAKRKGQQLVRLPPGIFRTDTLLNLADITGLTIRGAGRGLTTILQTTSGLDVFSVSGGAQDISIEDMTLQRSGGAGEAILVAAPTGSGGNIAVRRCKFVDCGIGVTDRGNDTIIEDVLFTGSTWTTFLQIQGANRPRVSGMKAQHSAVLTAGILIQGTGNVGTKGGSFTNIDILPTSNGGPCVVINNAGAGTDIPSDLLFSHCRFKAGTASNAVEVSGGRGVKFTSCIAYTSLTGWLLAPSGPVTLVGCLDYGCQNEGIDINTPTTAPAPIQIVEHLSSNVNKSTSSKDHVNIAAGVDDVYINGLVVGRFIEGTGTPQARDAVRVEAGVSDRIQIMGIRGTIADVTAWFTNASTSADVDISHNLEFGNNRTYAHIPISHEGQGGSIGIKTLVGTETTTSAKNFAVIYLQQSGATTITNFTLGADGQLLTLIALNGNTTINDGGNFRMNGNLAPALTDTTITFRFRSLTGLWYEVSRSVN